LSTTHSRVGVDRKLGQEKGKDPGNVNIPPSVTPPSSQPSLRALLRRRLFIHKHVMN